MPLPPKAERIHAAHHAAQVARLMSAGWSQDRAETAVMAWMQHADAEGRKRGRLAYWDGAEEWIVDRTRRR